MAVVDYIIDGHVATITINRPKSRNAINSEVAVRLTDAWRDIRDLSLIPIGRCRRSTLCSSRWSP